MNNNNEINVTGTKLYFEKVILSNLLQLLEFIIFLY
jgi:hypothetical protein